MMVMVFLTTLGLHPSVCKASETTVGSAAVNSLLLGDLSAWELGDQVGVSWEGGVFFSFSHFESACTVCEYAQG